RFLPSGEAPAAEPTFFRRSTVHVLVDRSGEQGAPVVFEHYPTFYRLVGRVEREATNGGPPSSDFTLIRSGALLQANGGYLVLRALDVWQNDLVWEELKRALLEGQVQPEDLSARGPMVLSNTLEPEPIPLQLKVILVGPTGLYFRLYGYDDDFEELFKARAEFDVRMERSLENEREYALFVAARCHQEGLRHFERKAVARLVELGSRLAGSQRKLSTRFGVLADLFREAGYWFGDEGRALVTRADVERAWAERVYRANLSEERERERFEDGSVSIDTSGEAVGLLNGLSVYRRADYSYGQPSRVAARTFAGSGGVVQIDREVNLTGPIHNKGV
ncbi:MAG: AAA family ATPase, partial [Chloroflexi bacterium]|nr:AAA family ATPase [Chloroflexota bacterium]